MSLEEENKIMDKMQHLLDHFFEELEEYLDDLGIELPQKYFDRFVSPSTDVAEYIIKKKGKER